MLDLVEFFFSNKLNIFERSWLGYFFNKNKIKKSYYIIGKTFLYNKSIFKQAPSFFLKKKDFQ